MLNSLTDRLSFALLNAWYRRAGWLVLLKPIAWVFAFLVKQRVKAYRSGWKKSWKPGVPVIVVGNITLGGAGKTPLVVEVVEQLKARGFSPGIVSRGFASKASHYPFDVKPDTHPECGGDEPVLMARRLGCPVVIDENRCAAARFLLANYQCDVLVSDDGLQHYAFGRDIEIAVVDADRGFGNGQSLPAGPLRETIDRLDDVDFVVMNGNLSTPYFGQQYSMTLVPGDILPLTSARAKAEHIHPSFEENVIGKTPVHAVAGIGNPQRFFNVLESLGYQVTKHVFPDHYHYLPGDLDFSPEQALLMTEKDAVKCAHLNIHNAWYLPVNAQLSGNFWTLLFDKIAGLPHAVNNQMCSEVSDH